MSNYVIRDILVDDYMPLLYQPFDGLTTMTLMSLLVGFQFTKYDLSQYAGFRQCIDALRHCFIINGYAQLSVKFACDYNFTPEHVAISNDNKLLYNRFKFVLTLPKRQFNEMTLNDIKF